MAIRIVTDSTADLSFKLAEELEIEVVPLNVHFGEEVLKDGVDIWSEEFYHRLINGPVLPNTSQPSPGEFLNAYQKTAQPGDTIISIHISQHLSGAIGSAQIAAEMLSSTYNIITIDSLSACMGLGLMVIRAARLAKSGVTAEAIIEQIHQWQKDIRIYFTVNNLEYLQRTGRIGKASALLGSLLNIKPLLSIVDGMIVPVEKIRGNFQKVAQEMVRNMAMEFGDRRVTVCIIHTELPDHVQILKAIADQQLQIGEYYCNLMGPVVGSHAGPHTMGLIAIPEE